MRSSTSPRPRRRRAPEGSSAEPAASRAEVTVRIRRRSPRPLVTVSGSLGTAGASLLSAVLEHVQQPGRTVEVDLDGVHHADRRGLAPVLDGRVVVRRASPAVRRLLALPHRT